MLKKIVICDRSQDTAAALAKAFAGESGVTVRQGDIMKTHCHAIVSPCNSFGDMGGGHDKVIDDSHSPVTPSTLSRHSQSRRAA